jgi:hypothetical protein
MVLENEAIYLVRTLYYFNLGWKEEKKLVYIEERT